MENGSTSGPLGVQKQQHPRIDFIPTAAVSVSAGGNASSAPPGRRLRGSCDFCTKRKRRCDGDGVNRCSFCVAKNQPECHYSYRLPTGPRRDGSCSANRSPAGSGTAATPAGSKRSGVTAAVGADVAVVAGAATEAKQRRQQQQQQQQQQQRKQRKQQQQQQQQIVEEDGMMAEYAVAAATATATATAAAAAAATAATAASRGGGTMVSLKRARLSASRVTGLVGLQENVYIGDYFKTLGFLPLVDESTVRMAMVSTMFSSTQPCTPGFPGSAGDLDMEPGWGEGVMVTAGTGAAGLGRAASGAAACLLWSTVALGSLVQGRPRESVAEYVYLARRALSTCFDDETAETARAYTSMALVHNFMGDEHKFNKHIDMAKSIVAALPPKDVPQDIVDTLLFVKACDMFTAGSPRYEVEHASTMAGSDDERPSMQMPSIFRVRELCRFLLKTDVLLGKCFHQDMFEKGVFCADGEEGSLSPGAMSLASPSVGVGQCGVGSSRPAEVPLAKNGFWSEEFAEPPPPGERSRRFAAEVKKDFELIEHATDTPELRNSVGELYFRSIMAYVYVLEGDGPVGLENILRCAEVILRSPGLCRFSAWTHLAHCIMAILVLSCCDVKYDQVREAYNSVVDDPCTKRPPPIEEWEGMRSVCDGVFCRSIYAFFTQRAKEGTDVSVLGSNFPIGSVCPMAGADDDIDDDGEVPASSPGEGGMTIGSRSSSLSAGAGSFAGFDTARRVGGEGKMGVVPLEEEEQGVVASGAWEFVGALGSDVVGGEEEEEEEEDGGMGGAREGGGAGVPLSNAGSIGVVSDVSGCSSVGSLQLSAAVADDGGVSRSLSGSGRSELGVGDGRCASVGAAEVDSAGGGIQVSVSSDGADAGYNNVLLDDEASRRQQELQQQQQQRRQLQGIPDCGIIDPGMLELGDASDSASLLDAVDALLGEAVLDGFGDGGGDITSPFFEENL